MYSFAVNDNFRYAINNAPLRRLFGVFRDTNKNSSMSDNNSEDPLFRKINY